MAQGRMRCLITYDDAEGLVYLKLVFIYILYQTEPMLSVICPCDRLGVVFPLGKISTLPNYFGLFFKRQGYGLF